MTGQQPRPDSTHHEARRTLVYESATTRVFRLPAAAGSCSVVCKQPRGANAVLRLQHEKDILALLAGIDGIAHPVAAAHSPGMLALEDGGQPLARLGWAEPPALPALLVFSQQLAQTLAAVHQAGVIHGDICPRNIVLSDPQGRPTLIDFDLASSAALVRPRFVDRRRTIAGTLAYMSPEQTGRTGRPVDQRADLYSLGVTLYELATGRLPFASDDLLELIHGHLVQVPVAPATRNRHLPQQLSDIIMRLLEKEPGNRYQSAQGLAHDLARLATGLGRNDTRAYELGQQDFGARLIPPARPIGRDRETAFARDALGQGIEGAIVCALVSGPTGVGKTTLVNEFRPLVAARGGWFVTTSYDQYQHDPPVAALRALGRLLLAEPESQLAGHRARILQAVGGNVGLGITRLPEFVLLLGQHPPVEIADPREAESRMHQETLDVLRSVASPERPLVMVLDNLQWAPSISLRFIDALITAAPGTPGLLVVGAYRCDAVDAGHPLAALARRWQSLNIAPPQLHLENLPPDAVAALVAQMLRLPQQQAQHLAAALNQCTAGNPQDTVELINALRQEGLLQLRDGAWHWHAPAIREYVGDCSVPDLLARRIAKLPAETRLPLEILACLGREVGGGMLEVASDIDAQSLQRRLLPAMEDGLVVLDAASGSPLRFRHPRVQQAIFESMEPSHRAGLHLLLGRRLLRQPQMDAFAAEQYLRAVGALTDDGERREVAVLFRRAASRAGALNFPVGEHFLAAAIALLKAAGNGDEDRLLELEIEHHMALYGLGRLAQADGVYASITARWTNPMDLVAPAGVQMHSLATRRRYREALDVGLRLLAQAGLAIPEDPRDDLRAGFQRLIAWHRSEDKLSDFQRPAITDGRILAMAALIAKTATAAYFCSQEAFAWLTLESHRMWIEHGPCAQLMPGMGAAAALLVGIPQDYRASYECSRHVVAVGEARGFEPGTSMARLCFALGAGHWVEPIESIVQSARRARVDLLRAGDIPFASYTYVASDLLFDCMPTLEPAAAEIEEGLTFAERAGNADYRQRYLPRRQLIRALQGKTHTCGGLGDEHFDEAAYVAAFAPNPTSATYHTMRAIAAAIFGDRAALAHHAAMATSLTDTSGFYITAMAQVLQAVSLAEQARSLPLANRGPLLAELDGTCLNWLAKRAADAPVNFLHLLRWVEAERAWAAGGLWQTGAAFDTAVDEAALHQRPWHQAIVNERAGLFHLSHGLEATGRALLGAARGCYEAWGATAKVQAMERNHAFLRARSPLSGRADAADSGSATVSPEAIDLMGVVRASQSLSSETSLEQLRLRVTELLGTMTGATKVLLALWHEDVRQWMLPAAAGAPAGATAALTVEEAGHRGLLPLSAFRYVERTLQPLLVEDATQDDRFAGDPYLQPLDRCSLLVIPILSQGAPRAVLLLENRLSASAFSADRLDAVTLIAGQLAVSLENAQLYQELEQRVQQRTSELRATQAELVATARRAGMAEIASNVLHNVGNILNSVNVSADLIRNKVRGSRAQGLSMAAMLIQRHGADLAGYFTFDEKGKLLPGYLSALAKTLDAERADLLAELGHLARSVDHIKEVVATQQSHAGASSLYQPALICDLVEDALRINGEALGQVTVVREFDPVPQALLDRTRIMQILVNLISNARHAMHAATAPARLTLEVQAPDGRLRIRIKDEGEGILPENLTRIFVHGFTTRKGGHGFGLHSCALAARQMGGTLTAESPGGGHGATFTLELPLETTQVQP